MGTDIVFWIGSKRRSLLFTMTSTNYKEAFSLYDKRGNGRVSLESLGDLLRACGQNPTLAEIRELEKQVGGDFDFDSFSKVLNRRAASEIWVNSDIFLQTWARR